MSSRTRRPTQKYYGYMAGDEAKLMPMIPELSEVLYGSRIEKELTDELRDTALAYKIEYATEHYNDVIDDKSNFRELKEECPKKESRPIREKIVFRKRSEGYTLVNQNVTKKSEKILVEQLQPRFPGDPVPKSSIRTEIDIIPVLDLSIEAPNKEAPEIVENPELIKPFARGQKNITILNDPKFIRSFKLTKEGEVGGMDINRLKSIAKNLGYDTQLSKENLIKIIDNEIAQKGINLDEE